MESLLEAMRPSLRGAAIGGERVDMKEDPIREVLAELIEWTECSCFMFPFFFNLIWRGGIGWCEGAGEDWCVGDFLEKCE